MNMDPHAEISAAFAAAQFKLQKCLFLQNVIYIYTYTRINKRKQTKGAAMRFIWFLLDVEAQSSCRVENACGNVNQIGQQTSKVNQWGQQTSKKCLSNRAPVQNPDKTGTIDGN